MGDEHFQQYGYANEEEALRAIGKDCNYDRYRMAQVYREYGFDRSFIEDMYGLDI